MYQVMKYQSVCMWENTQQSSEGVTLHKNGLFTIQNTFGMFKTAM